MDVAAAAHAALGHGDAFAVVREVGDELAHFLRFFEILVDDRAHRHLEHKVLAGGSVHARALAVRAALGFEMVFERYSMSEDRLASASTTTLPP